MSISLTQINPHKFATFTEKVYSTGSYWVTTQVKEVECGPCCIGIVLRQLRHPAASSTTIDMLREYSQAYTGGYKPTGSNVIGARPSLLAQVGAQSKTASYSGSYMSNLVEVLNKKFFTGGTNRPWSHGAYATTKELKQFLRLGSTTAPRICQVQWDNGGSHFIVGLGAEAGKQTAGSYAGHRLYYFSDPYYGLQTIRIPHEDAGGRLTYQPYDNNAGQWAGRGKFTTWVAYQT